MCDIAVGINQPHTGVFVSEKKVANRFNVFASVVARCQRDGALRWI
jgi:hypothetical protein